jgi:hypothetical protein
MSNAVVARPSEEGMMLKRALWIYRLTTVMAGAAAVGVLGAGVARADVARHGPITIESDGDFTSPGSSAGCACVSAGTGTASDPYVIGPWAITAPNPANDLSDPNASGSAITVDNSNPSSNPADHVTKYFTIAGISANYSDTADNHRGYPVIHLIDVNQPTTISNVSASNDGTGIELDGSSNIRLDSISVNKMNGTGIRINNSSYIFLSNGKYKATSDALDPASHWADGLYAKNSSYLYIGGPLAPACPKSGVCNTFDYDSGWGVYLQNTHHVVIDNATANADDTGGFVLDGGSNIALENSTSEAGGPICISLNGAKSPSGYMPTDLVGGLMLINGTQDDTISTDTFNGTSSSSGFSIGDGGNLDVNGNPFYFNVCTNMPGMFPPPPPPPDQPMGPNIMFFNVCYSTTDIPPSPPMGPPPTSICKS